MSNTELQAKIEKYYDEAQGSAKFDSFPQEMIDSVKMAIHMLDEGKLRTADYD